jgi:hypothetical protein
MSISRSVSPPKKDDKKEEKQEKRFLNGWSKEQEQLMAEWSDIALCYRWLHDNSEKIYHAKNLWINLPVIILTTLGGTASFGVQSVFSDPVSKQYASFAIGSVSLFAGILTTVGNYLRYAQLEESNRVASIAWGKFQRLIAIELAMNPNERMDAIDFLKICRADLDRLIEQSPPIPADAILVFEERFGKIKELKKPDICGALEHTTVFNSNESRLKQLSVDATLLMKQRRGTLNELLAPQVQETIQKKVDERIQIIMKKNEFELDKMPGRETRRDSMSRIVKPTIHKKEYHTIQIKPESKVNSVSNSPVLSPANPNPVSNVIVIPEIALSSMALSPLAVPPLQPLPPIALPPINDHLDPPLLSPNPAVPQITEETPLVVPNETS